MVRSVSRLCSIGIIVCLILVGTIEAVWGLLQVYGYEPSNHSLYALTGSFYNPGPYSGFLAMCLPVALHEYPQLGQVFLGRMSLVGPRPELLQYTRQYTGQELDILKVRPGITDDSSVEFINLDEIVGEEDADAMYEKYVLKKKNALRVRYAHTVSLGTDLRILLRTAAAVLDKIFGFIVKKEHR